MADPFDMTDPLTGLSPIEELGDLPPPAFASQPPVVSADPSVPANPPQSYAPQGQEQQAVKSLFRWTPEKRDRFTALALYNSYLESLLKLTAYAPEITSDSRSVVTAVLLAGLVDQFDAIPETALVGCTGVVVSYDQSFVNPTFDFVQTTS